MSTPTKITLNLNLIGRTTLENIRAELRAEYVANEALIRASKPGNEFSKILTQSNRRVGRYHTVINTYLHNA